MGAPGMARYLKYKDCSKLISVRGAKRNGTAITLVKARLMNTVSIAGNRAEAMKRLTGCVYAT